MQSFGEDGERPDSVIQFVENAIDAPDQRTVEEPQIQFVENVISVPAQKTVAAAQIQSVENAIDVADQKTMEVPQVQYQCRRSIFEVVPPR